MVATHHDINASPSVPQAVDRGLEKKPLPTLVAGELEPVVADLVKKALSNPAIWPAGLPATPVCSFGPSTPPLDADELKKQLVDAADTRGRSDCTDFEDSLGISNAQEIKLENVTTAKQHSRFPQSETFFNMPYTPPSEPVTMRQLKDLLQAVLQNKPLSTSDDAESGPVDKLSQDTLEKLIDDGHSSVGPAVATEPAQPRCASNEQEENFPAADKIDLKSPICTTPEDFKSFEKWASTPQFKTVVET